MTNECLCHKSCPHYNKETNICDIFLDCMAENCDVCKMKVTDCLLKDKKTVVNTNMPIND